MTNNNHGIPMQPSQSPYNVSGSHYNNHHAPPPPPPPRPLMQFPVVTPPMPPQSLMQATSQHQQPTYFQQQQQQHYQSYQGAYSPPSQYNYQHQQNYYYEQQQQQQQQQQGGGAPQLMMHQDQYSSYPYYANNYANPPPPPPPPRPQQHHQHHRGGGGGGRKHCCQIKNGDAASSLRQSLLPLVAATTTKSTLDEKSIDKTTQKKGVNPKMVQKYAGRGLKTITVSAPGMRPQKFRICVGNHPDDVKEWIEERKRRFPRQKNSTVEGGWEERREDKEVVGSAVSSRKRMRDDHDGNEGGVETKKAISNNENADEDHDGCRKRANIGGLSSLLAGYDSSSSTEEATSTSKDVHLRSTATTTTSMTETTITSTDPITPPKRICRHYRRGNCRLGASCKFLHSTDPIVVPATGYGTTCNSTRRQKNNGQSQSERDKARNRRDEEMRALGLALPVRGNRNGKAIDNTSLLHKLLRRDKEREHRLTLQLLRYIVDSDHFQAGDEDVADKEKLNSKISETK